MFLRFLLIQISLTFCTSIFAQNSKIPLNIGDTMPNILFEIKNYKKNAINFTEINRKLIILDFWDKTCSACISAFPEMERLQKIYADKIQVILITKNTNDDIEKLSERYKVIRNATLPMVVHDTIFSKYFPFKTVPKQVWIDSNQVVSQITSTEYCTPENIKRYLSGEFLQFPVIRDLLDFDETESLLFEGNGRQRKYLECYSFLMKNVQGIRSSLRMLPGQVSALNLPVLSLYKIAYTGGIFSETYKGDNSQFHNANRFLFKGGNSGELQFTEISKSPIMLDKSLYSYEIRIPTNSSKELFLQMRADLDRFFGYHSFIRKVKTKCLVLRRVSALSDKIESSGGKSFETYIDNADTCDYIIQNKSIQFLVDKLDGVNGNIISTPIINGTGFSNNVDVHIQSRLNDLENLRKELNKYGLDLVKEFRMTNVVVIEKGLN